MPATLTIITPHPPINLTTIITMDRFHTTPMRGITTTHMTTTHITIMIHPTSTMTATITTILMSMWFL